MGFYLLLSFVLTLAGMYGFIFSRKHSLTLLICLELLLVATNLNFTFFSVFLDDLLGQVYAFYLFVLAASESALALAIIILFYRLRGSIHLIFCTVLKT